MLPLSLVHEFYKITLEISTELRDSIGVKNISLQLKKNTWNDFEHLHS